jgi:hypothetical protein
MSTDKPEKKRPKKSLSVTHPELAKEADGWDPQTLDASSGKRVAWVCRLGHSWVTSLNYRVTRNSRCPYCLNQKVLIGFNDFATTHPELLGELLDSDGTDFVAGSTSRACEWKCSHGHVYKAKPHKRTARGQGCPFCSGRQVFKGFNDLVTTHPNIAKEAFDFDPSSLSAGSHQKVKWKCPEGHIYQSELRQRINKQSKCSVCYGRQIMVGVNDLLTTNPDLAKEADGWDPREITAGSARKVKWKCPKGHNWEATVGSRDGLKSGCPVCSGRKVLPGFNDVKFLFPEIAKQADGWDPSKTLAGTHTKRKWICSEGHNWNAAVKDRCFRGDGCPSCSTYGFDLNNPAWLYLLEHPVQEWIQIGITNHPDNRINDHSRGGWAVVDIRGPMGGLITRKWEVSILEMLKNSGAKFLTGEEIGKFSGYTEAWKKETFPVESIKELMRLTDDFENEHKY